MLRRNKKIKNLKILIKQKSGKNCAGSVEQFYYNNTVIFFISKQE